MIHLIAIAGASASSSTLDDWDRLGRGVHMLVNLMPSGKYLMEDFCYAGGLPAVLRELGENGLLHKDALTVNGKTIWENIEDAPCWNRDVITPFDEPFKKNAGIAVLRGNLAPRRRHHQAVGGDARSCSSTRAARWCSRTSRTSTRASTIRTLDIDENCVHGAEELRARRAIPAWPRSATCRCRPSC